MPHRVLILDSDRLAEPLLQGLATRDFVVALRASAEDGLALLASDDFDAVVLDIGLGSGDLCERCVQSRPDVPVIASTSLGTLETAVAAIRAGAYDYLTKPLALETLAIALERAVKHRALREEVRRLRRAVSDSQVFLGIVGASPAVRSLCELVERVADTGSTVLVTGETGTGKELVARALHARSRLRDGPFVAVNCAALPEPLLESELFGHARGAFTDARAAHAGLLVRANGGTLFLDEIGETSTGMQAKLLRALQERKVRPVGGDEEVPFDARIVVATNRSLEDAVAEGRFREDLFYRLNVIRLDVPPLRVRGDDVLLIAQHLLDRHAARLNKRVVGLSSGAAEKLLAYHWPGNVRELQNCIESAVALALFDRVRPEDLPQRIREYARSHVIVAGERADELVPMDEVERRYIARVLEAVGGNKTRAAQVLGFDRKTLYRKLDRHLASPTASGRWRLPRAPGLEPPTPEPGRAP